MSRVKGEMRICDRCGKQAFAKCTGEGEADGGYTRWNKFETLEGWGFEKGDLCPDCTNEWNELKAEFFSVRRLQND